MTGELLDIGEVARRTGRAPSALRFYERRGLIGSVDRRGLRRLFEPRVLDQVALIVAGQEAGFALDELHELVNGDYSGWEAREMMRRKAAEVDRQIQRLTEVRDRLQHAARCRAPHPLECKLFLAHVRAALPSNPPAPPCEEPVGPTPPSPRVEAPRSRARRRPTAVGSLRRKVWDTTMPSIRVHIRCICRLFSHT